MPDGKPYPYKTQSPVPVGTSPAFGSTQQGGLASTARDWRAGMVDYSRTPEGEELMDKIGEEAVPFLGGAINSLFFGIPEAVWIRMGPEDRAQQVMAWREAHPGTQAGEIAGIALSMLVPGGAGLKAASAGAKAVGATKTGVALAQAAEVAAGAGKGIKAAVKSAALQGLEQAVPRALALGLRGEGAGGIGMDAGANLAAGIAMGVGGAGLGKAIGAVSDGVKAAKAIKAAKKAVDAAEDLPPLVAKALKAGDLADTALKPKVGAKAEKDLGYDPVALGQRYPSVEPPVPAIDKRTGKSFMAKSPSKEAEALNMARTKAQKEIDAGNYQPYFDVGKREFVDSKDYPLKGNTLIDTLPAKEATLEEKKKLFDTPENRANIQAAYDKAKNDPNAAHWYAMKQLEKEFIDELGPELGRKMFKRRFADAMAATTGGVDPQGNLLLAAYMNHLDATGKPFPSASHELPSPIGGGKYGVMPNIEQYKKLVASGAGIEAGSNPKRFDFSANFQGHRGPATIDEQGMDLMAPIPVKKKDGSVVLEKRTAPNAGEYGVIEQVWADVAKANGLDPSNLQDVAWAGAKGIKGKPMIQVINEALARTAKVTGLSQKEVLRNFIRAQGPLYGIAATAIPSVIAAKYAERAGLQEAD
jgi:hypothetical protein